MEPVMTSKYRARPDAVRSLVQPDRVHRDLYIDEEIFALEREHFFVNTWNYVGPRQPAAAARATTSPPRSPASR